MASKGRGGYEFNASRRRTIAERANYQCIVPGCKTITVGPGALANQVASTGTACHIYSAAENGPRGRGGLSEEEIKSVENGVWACATHGRLIDTNEGGAYPASLIVGWKKLQEAQIKKARDHQPTAIGWVDQFSVPNSFLFKADAKLRLGKCTLVSGSHIGKTAICDWLATSLGCPLPDRWKMAPQPLLTSATVYTPEEFSIDLDISDLGVRAKLNGSSTIEVPQLVSVVHLLENAASTLLGLKSFDDDTRISKIFGIDRAAVRGLIEDIQRNGTSWGRGIGLFEEWRYEGDDESGTAMYSEHERQMELRSEGRITLQGLSGSELVRVLFEFSCALARQRAKHRPTILILDANFWPFDSSNWDRVGAYLPHQPYQVLLTVGERWKPGDRSAWLDWNFKRLHQVDGKTDFQSIDLP